MSEQIYAAVWGRNQHCHGRLQVTDEWILLDCEHASRQLRRSELVSVRRAAKVERIKQLPTLLLRFDDADELPLAPLGFGEITLLHKTLDPADSRSDTAASAA